MKFNDSKPVINKTVKITKHFHHIDMILKSLATTFILGTTQSEPYKTYILDHLMKLEYALGS